MTSFNSDIADLQAHAALVAATGGYTSGYNAFAVTVNPAIPSTGSLQIDVGEVVVRNLTALGQA